MSTRPVTSYIQSFLWITLLIVIIQAVRFNVELLFVDFIHANPHRPQSNALEMMETFTPTYAIVNVIGCFLVLALPQYLQGALVQDLEPRFGDRARFVIFLALPATAVLTWYCYDYLTPSNVCFAGPCWPPYEHGISFERFLMALAIQGSITLFNFLYFDAGLRAVPRWPLIIAALVLAIAIGGILGYFSALEQYQFLP